MYIKEYGKEFKIRNQVIILLVALFTGAVVYYLLPTGKQYAEKIYHVNIYVYLTTISLFLIIYNLKIVEDVTTRLRYAIPVSILIFTVTLVMSYIYNLILKGVKQAIVGKKVEEI